MTTNAADYMRRYMRDARQIATGRRSPLDARDEDEREQLLAERSQRASVARSRRRPGFCNLCGHLSPDPACPVCAAELDGDPYALGAWEVILSTPTE